MTAAKRAKRTGAARSAPPLPSKVETEWRFVHDPAALEWLLRFLFEPRRDHDQAEAGGGEGRGRKSA